MTVSGRILRVRLAPRPGVLAHHSPAWRARSAMSEPARSSGVNRSARIPASRPNSSLTIGPIIATSLTHYHDITRDAVWLVTVENAAGASRYHRRRAGCAPAVRLYRWPP